MSTLEVALSRCLEGASFPALLLDRDQVRFVNDALKELFPGDPAPASAYAGRRVGDAFPWLCPLPDAGAGEHRRLKTPNGRTLLVDFCPTAEPGLTVVFGRIVAAHEDALAELEVARELVQTITKLYESSYDGNFVTDGSGLLLGCNPAFLRMAGLTSAEALFQRTADLVAGGKIPNSAVTEALQTGEQVTALVRYATGIEAIETATPVFDGTGRLYRVISNVRDVSELNRLRDELNQANVLATSYREQLRQAQDAAAEHERSGLRSTAMRSIYSLAARVAAHDTPVLLLGESGVGKDVLAKFIHRESDRSRTGTLVTINCGAIPEQLLESELFGYEGGAFTGAQRGGKAGLFEVAHRGTLFLDEIGDMPLTLQVKLLTVLQEGRLYRVGGTREIAIDIRIIAATNADLPRLVAEGRFRKDLYYRLNVVPIQIPPLRERTEDVLPLALLFLEQFNQRYGLDRSFARDALDRLLTYPWPGNVRELRNTVERLVVTADRPRITAESLPLHLLAATPAPAPEPSTPSAAPEDGSLEEQLAHCEREILAQALQRHRTLKEAADALAIDLSTLVRKKRRFGLPPASKAQP